MKGTNEASKEGLKGRPGNLKRWAGGQGMTQKQERKGTRAGIREGIKAGKYRYNGRQRKEERQARKGTNAGKRRHILVI